MTQNIRMEQTPSALLIPIVRLLNDARILGISEGRTVNLQLEQVDSSRRLILERLLQLELYDVGMDPGPDGLIDWGESLDKFFETKPFVPLFFVVNNEIVGFALIKLERELGTPDGRGDFKSNFIAEFYVSRRWRRKGIGTHAADLIFRRYPGQWTVSCHPDDVRVAFWRHVATGRDDVNGVEFGPDEHKGFPGQYVWIIELAETYAPRS